MDSQRASNWQRKRKGRGNINLNQELSDSLDAANTLIDKLVTDQPLTDIEADRVARIKREYEYHSNKKGTL